MQAEEEENLNRNIHKAPLPAWPRSKKVRRHKGSKCNWTALPQTQPKEIKKGKFKQGNDGRGKIETGTIFTHSSSPPHSSGNW